MLSTWEYKQHIVSGCIRNSQSHSFLQYFIFIHQSKVLLACSCLVFVSVGKKKGRTRKGLAQSDGVHQYNFIPWENCLWCPMIHKRVSMGWWLLRLTVKILSNLRLKRLIQFHRCHRKIFDCYLFYDYRLKFSNFLRLTANFFGRFTAIG